MRFRFGAIALALVLAVVASGCGAKKKVVAVIQTTTAQTTTAQTTTAATTTAPATTTNGGTSTSASKPSFASLKNCAQLASLAKSVSGAIQSTSGNGKFDLNTEEEVLQRFADAAPSAIRGDFQTLAAAFGTFAKAISKAGYTPGKTPTPTQLATLQSAEQALTSPKLVAAEQHLAAWGTSHCG